jgi:L-fuconolactonase
VAVRIDSHQHFWKYDPVRDAWITPDMEAIRKDFLPNDLEPLLRASGMEGCVTVQVDQSAKETLTMLRLADEHPFIKGIVGWVDFRSPGIKDQLDQIIGRFRLHLRYPDLPEATAGGRAVCPSISGSKVRIGSYG